jgi:hypothetical protein
LQFAKNGEYSDHVQKEQYSIFQNKVNKIKLSLLSIHTTGGLNPQSFLKEKKAAADVQKCQFSLATQHANKKSKFNKNNLK